jgi:hypothetical protein
MQNEHKKLVMHVHGIGVADYLAKIEGLESEVKKELRKRFARSNKDLFADILRPTDKIFNSQGGSKSYQFKSTTSKENFTKSLSSIVDGYSIAQWLQMFFVDKIVIDPNGIYLIEHKDNKPYPTYKSILTVRDYQPSGRGFDWIVFEPVKIDATKSLVRVYDELFDYAYILENEQLRLDEGNTFKNPWGYVPAVTCSDRVNPLTGRKQSYVYEQVELADEYLRENSIKTLFKYHHGFPLFWQYMAACPVCKGQGFIDGKVCPSCNGTKYAQKKDISDVTYLKQPENSETPTIAPDIAGYVVPPIETWQQMTEELKMMRDMIYFSHWGTVINREDTDKTAFEVALNTQPMQDRLNHYTNSLESTEKYIVDMLAEYQYKGDYEGCSINYGRNYIIKSPNQYLTEYLEEKGKKASASVLNGKLEMYYNALYANDDYNRVVSLKLMYVEPFVHNDLSEVVGWNIAGELIAKKLYYNDWVSQLDKDSVLTKTIPELQAELTAFVSGKYKPNNKQDEA